MLAEQLRPARLEDIVGHKHQMDALRAQLRSVRIPHCFVLSGPTGCGKTTLARILSCMFISGEVGNGDVGVSRSTLAIPPTTPWNKFPVVHFINAASQNGIDDVRSVIDQLSYCPLPPWRAKVVVFDEAHQLTSAAQNALLTVTEDCPRHVFVLFCTTSSTKLLPALRRRAYTVGMGALSRDETRELLTRAHKRASEVACPDPDLDLDLDALSDALWERRLTNAGIVLQAAEKHFAGMSAVRAVTSITPGGEGSVEGEGSEDACSERDIHLCRAVASGNWKACCEVLRRPGGDIGDVFLIKARVLAYMRKVLLNTPPGKKAVSYARALSCVAKSANDEVSGPASLTAALALACEELRIIV